MPKLEEKVIYNSKFKLIVLCIGALVFICIGVSSIKSTDDYGSIDAFIGFLCIAIFGLALVNGLNQIFDKTPGLILKHDGFISRDRGFVPWEDVTEIDEVKVYQKKMIAIWVKDPRKYIEVGNFLQRSMLEHNNQTYRTPLIIAAGTLNIGHKELIGEMNKYLAASRENA